VADHTRIKQFNTDREIYERQARETDQAWKAFLHYRNSESRSLNNTAAALTKGDSIIKQWSMKWRWVERVNAYDRYLDQSYRDAQAKKRKQMADRHVKLSEAIQTKVATKLLNLSPSDMTAGDTARLLDVAVKIERLAMGAPTEHLKTEIEGQVSVKHEYDVAARIFSDTEARQLYLALMARLYVVEPDPSWPRDAREPGEVEIL
jgi:hypothetical protein